MEGVSGEGVRRRRREYSEEAENTRADDMSSAEAIQEKIRVREAREESSEPDELGEISANKVVEHAIEKLREQEEKEGEISRKVEDALEDLERMERANESTEDKIRDALESIDNQDEKIGEKLETRFTSMEEIDKAYQQHEHLDKEMNSETREKCEQYIRIVNEESKVSDSEITDIEGIEERTVRKWREGETFGPTAYLRELENSRLEHEANVTDESLEHRIDPENVREVTAKILEQEEKSVKELTDVVEQLYQRIDNPELNRVHYAELYETDKPLMDDGLRDLAREIRINREEIEADLNRRLGLDKMENQELRVAVTDNRLYYWYVDTSPDRWLNVLADQKFYMSKENKLQLIDDAVKHLHVRGGGQTSEYYLNDLLSQLSRLENPTANRMRRYDTVYSFDGETFHFIGDVTGRSLEDFKQIMTAVGTKKASQVSNLKFPDIHEFRMRFAAVAESDCHLDGYGKLTYYEKNAERRKIATDFFHEFGDFIVKEDKEGGMLVRLPKVFGAIAKSWGIPEGDKAIHNKGLHESVINESLSVKRLYPEEMVPEDGSIYGSRISITRYNVLHAGERMDVYQKKHGIEPLVDKAHIDYVRNYGEPQDAQLCYQNGEIIRLYVNKLKELSEENNNDVSPIARDLIRIVNENTHKLLNDEVKYVLEPLGIKMAQKASFLQYYSKSGRLSMASVADTITKEDAIRWVLVAPPNHPDKMNAAIELVKKNQMLSHNISKQIEKDGLTIHPKWESHLLEIE